MFNDGKEYTWKGSPVMWAAEKDGNEDRGDADVDDEEESRGKTQTDTLWPNLEWRERWHQVITSSPPSIAGGAGSSAAPEANALVPAPQAPTVGTLGIAVAWCVEHE